MNREQLIEGANQKLALAPFKPGEWIGALSDLARATESSHAQLAGWIAPDGLPFSLVSDEPDGLIGHWLEAGGADPRHNPIVARGERMGVLEIVSDAEVISRDARRRHPMWGEFYDKVKLPHLCFTTLWREGPASLMLTLPRSPRDGVITDDQRSAFAAVAVRFQRAAMLARSLQQDGTRLLKGAFDAIAISALVLDGFGRLIGASRAAEDALRSGTLVQIRHGKPRVEGPAAGELDLAVQACLRDASAAPRTVRTRSRRGKGLLRISPLPRHACDFGFGAAVLVVIEPDAPQDRPAQPDIPALLTPSERVIAAALIDGHRPREIAEMRASSIETVRTHIKNIYAKAGVGGHIEFMIKARPPRPADQSE